MDVRCSCVCVCASVCLRVRQNSESVPASPSKFGVYVKVQRSTDSPAAKSQGGLRAVVLYLGLFTAFCLAALTDFFSRFSSPESFASLSVVPPSNCVPSEGTECQLGRESLANVA